MKYYEFRASYISNDNSERYIAIIEKGNSINDVLVTAASKACDYITNTKKTNMVNFKFVKEF